MSKTKVKMQSLSCSLITCTLLGFGALSKPATAQDTSSTTDTIAAQAQVGDGISQSPTVEEVQKWLKDKIQTRGRMIEYPSSRQAYYEVRFTNVAFDGGIISYEEDTRYFRNDSGLGFSQSHTDSDHREIDLSKIQPNSFKIHEQAQTADETNDGKAATTYSIDCLPDNLSPVLYFEDKNITQRIVNALNFLSQHVDHPPAKPEPF